MPRVKHMLSPGISRERFEEVLRSHARDRFPKFSLIFHDLTSIQYDEEYVHHSWHVKYGGYMRYGPGGVLMSVKLPLEKIGWPFETYYKAIGDRCGYPWYEFWERDDEFKWAIYQRTELNDGSLYVSELDLEGHFDDAPDGEITPEETQSLIDELSRNFSVPSAAIERYFIQVTKDNRGKKAYPIDQGAYGDYWQRDDLIRKLGIWYKDPLHHHFELVKK